MTRTELNDTVKALIVQQFEVSSTAEELNNPETTMDELGADGLDLIELVMAAEEELMIEFDDERYDIGHSDEELASTTIATFTESVAKALDDAGKPLEEDNAQA